MKYLSILFSITCTLAFSQVEYTKAIDFNNASGTVGDVGRFFYDWSNGSAGYEIPKGSGQTTIFASLIWVGSEDGNGQVHLTYSNYTDSQFSSGPIANEAAYSSMDYQEQYWKSIWEVTEQEIEQHIENYDQSGYTAPASILEWPGNGDVSLGVAEKLAPFVDVNNDGVYSPMDGDYPDIRGGKAVYVILNDKSYQADNNALGAEVHLMFYQYSSSNYLNNTTFLHTQVFNRSNTDYYNFRQSFYVDFDIGDYINDYVGCNSTNHVIYGYNGNGDEDFSPCQGVLSLNKDLYSFSYFKANTGDAVYPYNDPENDAEAWNLMNAKWADGSPYLDCQTGQVTNLLLDGNPYTNEGCTEENEGNPYGDRRSLMTIAEDELLVGNSVCADFAFIFDQSSTAENAEVENVQNVINIAYSLRQLYASQTTFPCQSANFTAINEKKHLDFEVYPNPSSRKINIQLSNIENGTVSILDITGKEVYSSKIQNSFHQMDLFGSSGVYFVTVRLNGVKKVKKLILK